MKMEGRRALQRSVVAATLLHYALALPQARITVAGSPMPWVTVDATGSAQTITPGVITTHGQLTTLSDAASELRSTATYTVSPGGQASTYTGLAPLLSATGTGDSPAGVFPACDSDAVVGPVKPFCLPRAGSELHPGRTYYITWSPAYFSPPTINLTLQALISNPTPDSPSSPGGGGPGTIGLTSPPIPASAGFYALYIPPDFLQSRGNPFRLDMAFYLLYTDTNPSTSTNPNPNPPPPPQTATAQTPQTQPLQTTLPGPTILLTEEEEEEEEQDNNLNTDPTPRVVYPNIVPILLPILGAVAVAAGVALCTLSWRRGGRVRRVLGPVVGGRRKGVGGGGGGFTTSAGDGVGGGVGGGGNGNGGNGGGGVVGGGSVPWGGGGGWGDNKSETDVGIQLTDRASWSPTGRGAGGGRNVFREEIERQERLR